MEGPTSAEEIEAPSSKRRKVLQKVVVTVRVEANAGKQKGDGPPSDFWSWRKYGQKPIKGSPYPSDQNLEVVKCVERFVRTPLIKPYSVASLRLMKKSLSVSSLIFSRLCSALSAIVSFL